MRIEVYQNGNVVESRDLGEGSYKIGRAPECDIRLRSPQISKQHALLVIKGDKAAIVDLGSSNGVFVNGILIRKQRVEPGDDITIVDFKIKIVPPGRPQRAAGQPAAAMSGFGAGGGGPISLDFGGNAAPDFFQQPMGQVAPEPVVAQSPQERLLELMDQRILVPFYSVVKTVDWRWILSSILLISLVASVLLAAWPIVRTGRKMAMREAIARAHTVIAQTVRENARIYTKTNELSGFTVEAAEAEEGMLGVYIVDPKTKQILAPQKYFNKSLVSTDDLFVIEKLIAGVGKVDKAETQREDGIWILAQPITLTSLETSQPSIVAIVLAQFEPNSDVSSAFEPLVEASLFAVLLSLFAFFFIYKMMTYPINTLAEQLDANLKGENVPITCEAQMPELEFLTTQLNFAVSRMKKEGGGMASTPINAEDSEQEDADYVRAVRELDEGTSDGLILLDRDKRIKYVGAVLGELVGLKQQYAEGQNIGDACKDPGLAGTCIDLTDSVINSLGQTQTATLDVNGIARNMVAIGRKNRNAEIRFVLIILKLGGGES